MFSATRPAAPDVDEASVWRHRYDSINGVRLHWVECGAGTPVLLLHGFPDFWWSWRHQIDALAAAGHRIIAVDLRGYNESAKPRRVRAYTLDRLVDDVAGLITEVADGRAAIVGHDWGGIVGWQLAERRPELLRRLVVINAPHPAAFRRALKRTNQLLRSSYVLPIQLPRLAEQVLAARGGALIGALYRREWRLAGGFDASDVAQYRRVFSTPGSLRGPLNYYRALLHPLGRRNVHGARGRRIRTPTLVLWGERDRALHPSLPAELDRYAEDVEVIRFPRGRHWLHRAEPAAVNSAISAFLA
jgi:epoxide hydrolase 4